MRCGKLLFSEVPNTDGIRSMRKFSLVRNSSCTFITPLPCRMYPSTLQHRVFFCDLGARCFGIPQDGGRYRGLPSHRVRIRQVGLSSSGCRHWEGATSVGEQEMPNTTILFVWYMAVTLMLASNTHTTVVSTDVKSWWKRVLRKVRGCRSADAGRHRRCRMLFGVFPTFAHVAQSTTVRLVQ